MEKYILCINWNLYSIRPVGAYLISQEKQLTEQKIHVGTLFETLSWFQVG